MKKIKLPEFTQKISKDISETYIEKYNKMLSSEFKNALVDGRIETDMDHMKVTQAIHQLTDVITDSQSFEDHCSLASHFINDNDLEDGQLFDFIVICTEDRDLPFVCYFITFHLFYKILEKNWVRRLLPNALD